MAYTDEQKALVAAAVGRYGFSAALPVLKESFRLEPSLATLHIWIRDEGLQPTEAAVRELAEIDQRRKAGWQASLDARRDRLLSAFDDACEDGNGLKAQQFAMAVGIFYDKLVPPLKAGVTVNAGGEGATVNLLVVAPSSEDEHRQETTPDSQSGVSLQPADGIIEG